MTQILSKRREQTRARLLDAAHEVFGEVGMDAASVEMICERAGFTRGAFYSNFESKEDLLLALITQLARQKLDEIAARVDTLDPDGPVDLPAFVRRAMGPPDGDRIGLQLGSEIRSQALRDARLGAAYLAWQTEMSARITGIVTHVASVFDLRLRLPAEEIAQVLIDVSDETCVRGVLEGRTDAEVNAQHNARIERLVSALVDA
ncbi:TetR/AcrR family transcriptional regulator [Microbacterium sp. No. 7]|uniref:TetR/AcrR family transcriptional regulator n=1 Tax=Microbacterium sp. No. 7 TaxID=1714373 RepID=UPI0006CFCA00|nr:TetR/AcrR family transcriptional regulator [Microbacterium sp. No. 7]ALJ21483.1 hypothetical protein AOA12_16930 [Microbacterium sp. No. 7]